MSELSLLMLLQVSDSAVPSGSLAVSNGLETIVKESHFKNSRDLEDLMIDQVAARWFEFDRYFINQAFLCAGSISELKNLDVSCHIQNTNEALALASRRIGRSLITVHKKLQTKNITEFSNAVYQGGNNEETGYEPVVRGLIGWSLNLSLGETEIGALFGTVSAFSSVAVRMNIIGALEAQQIIADALPKLCEMLAADCPKQATSSTLLSEIAASRHKHLDISLFSN